jgi:SAM-dependent methyltransferase
MSQLTTKIAYRLAGLFGVQVYQPSKDGLGYALFSYTRPDGSFDYKEYRRIQEQGNRQKITQVFADEKTLEVVAKYLENTSPGIQHGLCHGTRRGFEQQWLSDRLKADVIGSEISDTAIEFPRTVQWDFHDENPEWVGAFDFVYSNSHDHAYDPKRAISTWVDQLKPGGAVVLEHTDRHTNEFSDALDPWGVRPELLPYLIAKWGSGKFAVTEILEPEFTKARGYKIWLFVIRKVGPSLRTTPPAAD